MKLNYRRLLLIIGLMMINVSTVVYAATDTTQVDRYLLIANQPLVAQSDLLMQTFQVRFPNTVITNGDAVHYLLRFSGYSLVGTHYQSKEVAALLAQPLPEVNHNFGPMTLQTGLMTLIGKPFGLWLDPVHRMIAFRLLPHYQMLYQAARYYDLMPTSFRN